MYNGIPSQATAGRFNSHGTPTMLKLDYRIELLISIWVGG